MNKEKIIHYIVKELNTYCENAGLKGFVVGVSGGIDSAVTSTLSAKTGKPVIALNMPILQAKTQDSLSSRHIDWLKINYSNVQDNYNYGHPAYSGWLLRQAQRGIQTLFRG